MSRRIISLPLPASDPHSAAIVAWLEAQPAGTNIAPALRRLIAEALATVPRLAAIEARLDQLLAGGGIGAPPVHLASPGPANSTMAAAVDELLVFGL